MLHIVSKRAEPTRRPLSTQEKDASSTVASGRVSASADVQDQLTLLDPEAGGWKSEVLSSNAEQHLQAILEGAATGRPMEPLLAEDITVTSLAPDNILLEEVFRDEMFRVRRAGNLARQEKKQGKAAFLSDLQAFSIGQDSKSENRLEHKIIGIHSLTDEGFTTKVRVQTYTPAVDGVSLQQNAIWNLRWRSRPNEEAALLLSSLAVESYEIVTLSLPQGLLTDHTAAAFSGVTSAGEQFGRGHGHWAQRVGVLEASSFLGHHGIAVGDVNGDGRDDLYVCESGGLPNRLYIQKKDGALQDISATSGTDWLEYSPSALMLDLDNDGDQDLVVGTVQLILFMENDGHGLFHLAGSHDGPAQTRSMAAADYDNDGDLDLYVCSYANPNKASGFGSAGVVSTIPIPYHHAENGSPNLMLENRGSFEFADITEACGLDTNNTRFSFAASWEDSDRDGDLDLYVANDFGRNNLYRNEGGRFRDTAAQANVEDTASGMSVAWGDVNRDGHMDLYVGNMFSAAGNRVAFQRRFEQNRSLHDLKGLQRMARGNTLFMGSGDSQYTDVSEQAGVSMGQWAWSSHLADINNDGWLDLLIGNGFLTNRLTNDL